MNLLLFAIIKSAQFNLDSVPKLKANLFLGTITLLPKKSRALLTVLLNVQEIYDCAQNTKECDKNCY
jgi:hypothetical protein